MARSTDDKQLDPRSLHLLKSLVDRYIREGQPVGSRTLSRDSGLSLSPATIRNVMSDLEHLGLIHSPHTSAGRVPTARGYRVFVDSLLKVKPLARGEVSRVQRDLAEHDSSSRDLVSTASRLLSDLTRLAGVVTMPRHQNAGIRQIEFLRLSERRILTIIVLNTGEVQNRILHPKRDFNPGELERAANYLNRHFAGKTVAQVREGLVTELGDARQHLNDAMIDAIAMANAAFDADDDSESAYVLRGQVNLMDFDELTDVDKLRRLFEAFNERSGILHLLDQSLSSDGVQIFIGDESGYELLEECSVVAAPYTSDDDDVIGVLAVIGPTRMAYERVIPVVDITARLLGAALNSSD